MSDYKTKKYDAPDESVQLPAAIRAAAARSDALHKAVYETGETDTKVDPKPSETHEQPPAGQEENKEGKEAPADPSTEKPETWEHKYNSLKGRYDKTNDTITGLNSQIAQLRAQLANTTVAPREPERTNENTFKSISAEEREVYGDDFIDVAARAAQEKLSPEFAKMQRELAELKGQLGGVAAKTHEQTQRDMYATLDEKLPNWREVNRDAKFIAWVNLPDAYSGAIRMDMLKEAHAKGDAQRVLAFFNGFLNDEAATAPARQTAQPSGKVPLESFAAPGRAKAPAATEVPGEKETISHAQIANFYAMVNKGHYKGNEAEKDRLEQMIFAAQRDGRVT